MASLWITVGLTNGEGATMQRMLAFSPFGLNTANKDLHGREDNAFREITLERTQISQVCRLEAGETVMAAKRLP